MKTFQMVIKGEEFNYRFDLTESKLRADYSMRDEDKEACLNLAPTEVFFGTFKPGGEYAVKRIS